MNTKTYIKKYILPNEPKENIIDYYDNNLEYNNEYLKEHICYNTLLNKETKNKLIKTINK
jgi:hypothetical protein